MANQRSLRFEVIEYFCPFAPSRDKAGMRGLLTVSDLPAFGGTMLKVDDTPRRAVAGLLAYSKLFLYDKRYRQARGGNRYVIKMAPAYTRQTQSHRRIQLWRMLKKQRYL